MRAISAALIACAAGCWTHSSPAEAAKEKVLYSFCSRQGCVDGATPRTGLINVNGELYGTTVFGGSDACNYGCGTLFAVDPETGHENILHSFQIDGTDGFYPSGGLSTVGDTLYGTTSYGGGNCYNGSPCGTVFSLNLTNDTETVLYSFCSKRKCKDGVFPVGSVIAGKILYGLTSEGGKDDGDGTIFSLKLETGVEKERYSFQYESKDGFDPESTLIDVHGKLYGTTSQGGTGDCYGEDIDGCGTVFSFDPKSGVETVLHSFDLNGEDGWDPFASVIDVNGELYGTTPEGGSGGRGTVFSLDPDTGVETVNYSFCNLQNCADGESPYAGLIHANGKLYGTTYQGGAHGWGTVFSIDLKTGKETVVYSFCRKQNCADGALPWAGLIDVNGTLYGTTSQGGVSNQGTVFSIVP